MNPRSALGPALFLLAAPILSAAQTLSGSTSLWAPPVNTNTTLASGCADEQDSLSFLHMGSTGCEGPIALHEAAWQRHAGKGEISSSVFASGSSFQPWPCQWGLSAAAHVSQHLQANDVVFRDVTDPTSNASVLVSLNVEYSGTYAVAVSCTGSGADVLVAAGHVSSSVSTWTTGLSGAWIGALAGYPNDGSTVTLASPPRQVLLNVPQGYFLSASENFQFTNCAPYACSASTSLTLPRNGPVFDLPPNITVDSVQLGIVDNHYVGNGVAFVAQPQDEIVARGADASFVAIPDGSYASLRWRKDGVDLVDGPTASGSTIVGADSPTLLVLGVAPADEGTYTCSAQAACGETTSAPAELRLRPQRHAPRPPRHP